MARETKRLYVFGADPTSDPRGGDLDGEAIELKRKPSKPDTESAPIVRADLGRSDSSKALSVDSLDDDDTVALPLAVRPSTDIADEPTAVRPLGDEQRSRDTRRATRGHGAGAAEQAGAAPSGRRASIGGTMLMAPEDHPAEPSAADANGPTSGAAVSGGDESGEGGRRCAACGMTFSSPDVLFCPFDGDRLVTAPSWDPNADPLLGKTIAERYEIQAVLAEGSMGTVYRVRHARLGTQFALKVLRRDLAREKDLAARLVDEARATAAIGHPNIVAVTDFGEVGAELVSDLGEERLPYFVMELLGGESLSEALAQAGPMAPERVARIALQCAQALAAAHAAGIVHRDLKPGNIRLVASRRGDIVKILDFGVAKILGSSRRTKLGTVFGTPHYMSPEQGRGHEIDHRTDIYSLGVIMYQCLTGRVPFEADTYMGVVTKHLFTRPEPMRVGGSDEREAHRIEPVVMRCLEKDAANRYQTMDDLAHDLEAVLAGEPSGAERRLAVGRRLRLREPEAMAATAQADLPAPLPLARSKMPWAVAGLAAALAVALAWWRPWHRPVQIPAPRGGATVSIAATTTPPSPVGDPSPALTASAVAAEAIASAASTSSSARAPIVDRPRPTTDERSSPKSSAQPTAVAEPAPTPTPAPPRPTATPPRHGGDVVDPWHH